MLGIYSFIFTTVFKARWSGTSDSKVEFSLLMFIGLIVHAYFADCVSKAPSLVLINANYVKKVVFPLDVLAWIGAGTALFHFGVSILIWLLMYVVAFGVPHATLFLLPLGFIPLVLAVVGLCWFLSSLGVYLRDVSQIIGVFVTAVMFLSPIFYPVTALPEPFRALLYCNPLTWTIEFLRDIMYWGRQPNWLVWFGSFVMSTGLAWAGFAWFQKTRKGFSDVI